MTPPAYPGHVLRRGSRDHANVRRLQEKLKVHPYDGIFGKLTESGVKAFQRRHGLLVDGEVGPATWATLFGRAAPARAKATSTDVERALVFARRRVGVHEVPYGSNRGPLIDAWNRSSGVAPGPAAYWCQSFANAVLVAGGGVQLHSGYTVAVVQWGRDRRFGLRVVSYADRKPGDFIYFKFPGVSRDFCDHVGVLDLDRDGTFEGNTSDPGVPGSQNNGGQVALRHRGSGLVVAVVRPTYGAHA